MIIFVFGNPDFEADSLPLRILPKLKKRYPEIDFKILDPNEEWDLPEEVWVMDTVLGIMEPAIFTDLEDFYRAPRLTTHDFDAVTNLRYLKKLGKFKSVRIIGVPGAPPEDEVLEKISKMLKNIVRPISPSKSA